MNDTKRRQDAIDIITGLFPADSDYPDTAEKGIELLEQAKRDCEGWRSLPTPVLIRYAELCVKEENRQAKAFREKHNGVNRI